MHALGRTSALRVLMSVNILVSVSPYHPSVQGKQNELTPPAEVVTSLHLPVATKVVLHCPPVSSVPVVITWIVYVNNEPSCTRAYRRDGNETTEANCTDERVSWDSRPDQNSALRIDPVAMIHEGYYSCELATPEGHFTHSYYLHVSVPPTVTLFRGSNGTLVCRAAAGKPAARISWTPGGDCHTEEQQLDNGTVTVQSTCHWEGRQVSNVSCFVSHPTGKKNLSLEPGDQLTLNLTLLYVISSISVALVIVGSIWLWKIRCCRKC